MQVDNSEDDDGSAVGTRPLITLGARTTHGGRVITATSGIFTNGRQVAVVGDIVSCPGHGFVRIESGDKEMAVKGRPVARLNDFTTCGAMLIPLDDDAASC